ncbi:MAG: hypothetical protein Pg6B_00240 [Candidatus Azobacteroides pseudotrichonymphae]|nr:MAG: hypothetical protein Pg6B_00240 [Candidatus Azobacteroides pseudotrichonymphae]
MAIYGIPSCFEKNCEDEGGELNYMFYICFTRHANANANAIDYSF